MSLRSLITNSVATAFEQLDDLVVAMTYTTPNSGYDPATGLAGGSSDLPCRGVMTQLDAKEIVGDVQISDQKAIIHAVTLPVIPNTGGSLTVGGVVYKILSVRTDPAEASHELIIRR